MVSGAMRRSGLGVSEKKSCARAGAGAATAKTTMRRHAPARIARAIIPSHELPDHAPERLHRLAEPPLVRASEAEDEAATRPPPGVAGRQGGGGDAARGRAAQHLPVVHAGREE